MNFVTCCVIVYKYLCICNRRRGWGEVEGNIQFIRVFLVFEWERGALVKRDPHEVVGSAASFTSEDTRLWLNDIESDFYGLGIILARYLQNKRNFEYDLE